MFDQKLAALVIILQTGFANLHSSIHVPRTGGLHNNVLCMFVCN